MSKIEWTDVTWNPVTGCTPIATGCKNCYAKEMHRRMRAMGVEKYAEPFSVVCMHPGELEKPLRWRKPRMVFVSSMSDLFHDDVDSLFIQSVFMQMAAATRHTFQVLTKRPERMARILNGWVSDGLTLREGYTRKPLHNVWLGTSASTQTDFDTNVPHLLQAPAAVQFVSLEPLLGPIDLRDALHGYPEPCGDPDDPEWEQTHPPLDWVIAGCESGPHRRPCEIGWIENIVRQCIEAGVPVFVKQADIRGRVVKMPEILGRVWDQIPE